jgi:hypothetical protein
VARHKTVVPILCGETQDTAVPVLCGETQDSPTSIVWRDTRHSRTNIVWRDTRPSRTNIVWRDTRHCRTNIVWRDTRHSRTTALSNCAHLCSRLQSAQLLVCVKTVRPANAHGGTNSNRQFHFLLLQSIYTPHRPNAGYHPAPRLILFQRHSLHMYLKFMTVNTKPSHLVLS